jgi:hypothetical protein
VIAADFCPTCGNFLDWEDCWAGCDDGVWDDHDEDPINSPPGTWVTCGECRGKGGFLVCFACRSKARAARETA